MKDAPDGYLEITLQRNGRVRRDVHPTATKPNYADTMFEDIILQQRLLNEVISALGNATPQLQRSHVMTDKCSVQNEVSLI